LRASFASPAQVAVHVDVFEGGRKVAEGAFGPDGVGRGKYTFARRDAVRKVV
jgi:hypothetical protein